MKRKDFEKHLKGVKRALRNGNHSDPDFKQVFSDLRRHLYPLVELLEELIDD